MKRLDLYSLRARPASPLSDDRRTCLFFLSISFVAGCFAGSIVGYASFSGGLFLDVGAYAAEAAARGWLQCFWPAARFTLVAFLFGFSLFGFVGIPVVVLFSGYSISCTAASIMSCAENRGFIMSLVLVGLSAVYSVPCLFLVSCESMNASTGLFRMYQYGNGRVPPFLLLRRFAAAMLLSAAFATAELYLTPILVSL